MSPEGVGGSSGGDDRRVAYDFGPFRLVPAEYRLERGGEEPQVLQPMPLKVLLFLVQNPLRLLTRDEVFIGVWEQIVEDNTLNAQISTLRDVMRDGENGAKFIETLPKRGIRFKFEVTKVWLDAEAQAKGQSATPVHDRRPTSVPSANEPALRTVEVAGDWNAIWETTAHNRLNVNHEFVMFMQDGVNIIVKNNAASSDNKDGGYLWEARLTLHDNSHMVGAYARQSPAS
jgi:DNA-binding winged helix-turn-helix (wHTH) protein